MFDMSKNLLPSYEQLELYYPRGSSSSVKKFIGGKVDAQWINNTCAIRMSRALNYSGAPIPREYAGVYSKNEDYPKVVSGEDKKWYIYRVEILQKYLTSKYGRPESFNISGNTDIPESLFNRKGIIVFSVRSWNDATGHATLWNGKSCIVDDCYFPIATHAYFWPVISILNTDNK